MRIAVHVLALAVAGCVVADAALDDAKRQELIRDLTAEYGTARVIIPRSKKPLDIQPDGSIDARVWGAALNKSGPAAREGDLIQITRVEIKGDRVIFELNFGISGGRKWWHRVQVSGGGGGGAGAGGRQRGTTLGNGQQTHAPGGTEIALLFDGEIPQQESEEFLKLLRPVLDFELRSADEMYMDSIAPEFRAAIEQQEVIEGMDRDMTLLAKGKPDRKVRDFEDGVETEDWIYGKPPGDVVFVTFEDGTVIGVKHAHANLGGRVSERKPIER